MASRTGTFGATGTSTADFISGKFSLTLSGYGSATVQLQRSFDSGSNWKVVETFTADDEVIVEEAVAQGVQYRLECTVYGSGTIAYGLHWGDLVQ